ncbi:hypothetical protein ACIHFD_10155 [Nonomuraea sp. NPDC051941]|uniref:hypothetical protein n=1 Tax=Nonomuraea sp. NPDC051941 TaxID=3364373 RepID=UPI0037CB0A8B
MRNSLIAVGGALLAATALYGSATPATADDHGKHHNSKHCGLGVGDDITYHHVTDHGVFAGTRKTKACKDDGGAGWDWSWDPHWHHRNWPTSGNGNWVGSWPDHGFHHDD